jgi:hypothetical protein
MKMNAKFFLFLILNLALLAGLSGCAAAKPAGLSDPQVAGVMENILKSIDANDYQECKQDFSDKMNTAFTQAQFTQVRTMLQKASGAFVSVGTAGLSNNQGYAVYRFTSKYANESVYVTVTFLVGGQKVEGLWFDSPNLRKIPNN